MVLEEDYKAALIEDVCRFVRIPSRSSAQGGEEGELQSLIAERMRSLGARVRTFVADDVPEFRSHPLCHGPKRQYEDRPTVIGELGPESDPCLLVLAHSDTVQINRPEDWTFDPFCPEIHDSNIRGLGASDDKWGLAAMLTIMRALRESGMPLSKKLTFASTIDEENGVGNGTLLLMLAGLEAEVALYLDGYQMRVFIGNMGGSNLYLRPKRDITQNDTSRHAELLNVACRQLSRHRVSLFTRPFYEDNVTKDESVRFVQRSDDDGPFFMIPFYTLPGEDRAEFCRELEAVVAESLGGDFREYGVSYREPWFEPALIPRDTSLIYHLSASILERLRSEPSVTTISKQDSFILTNHAKIPTVSFGPRRQISGRGACHEPDEYLSINELWDGCCIAYSAIWRWLQEGNCDVYSTSQ